MTNMSKEEIKNILSEIKNLKEKYFDALDNFQFDLAKDLDKKIVALNNSIN